MRIAVIDDAPDNLNVIRLFLEDVFGEGNVDGYANGEDFLANLSQAFDLAVIDISLPGINGYEVLNRIRIIDASLPAIAFTAHAFPSEVERTMAAGFTEVITKPVLNFDEFCETINMTARRNGGRHAALS